MSLSKEIELILAILDQCKSDKTWYENELKEIELQETNIAHYMIGIGEENEIPPKYKKRAKLATELQKLLLCRRAAKDKLEVIKILATALETDTVMQQTINKLRQILGQVRSKEKSMLNRKYNDRTYKNQPDEKLKSGLNTMIKEWKKGNKKHG